MSFRSIRSRWLRSLAVVGAVGMLTAAAAASPAVASPSPTFTVSPESSVSSDGTVEASAPAAVRGVASYAGTGVAAPGARFTGTPVDGSDVQPPDAGSIQSIIGADNRVRVNPTTNFPHRAIVQIVRTSGGTTWGCTGWLYGPNIVATAGHCVHPGGGQNGGGPNGFYAPGTFTIIPGRNGATNPYGTCTANTLWSVNGWTQSGSHEYDYGAIRLNCSVGNNTGWFGFWWQTASLNGQATTVSGYPCDKPFGEQWQHAGMSVTNTHVRQVFYQNDTFGCQSGSPVFQNRPSGSAACTGWCVMAIHAYGTGGSAPWATNNSGTRITEGVFNNLINWRNS